MHPNRECSQGRHHVTTEIAPGVQRCAWCGAPVIVPAAASHARAATLATETAPSCCGGSTTRQANYPRPTITERHDSVTQDFGARFRTIAQAYAASSPQLQHWQQQGNRLPEVYR